MKIFKQGDLSAIETDIGLIVAQTTSEISRSPFSGTQTLFSSQPYNIAGFLIHPMGDNNTLPAELRKILDDNHITSELINKQTQLLWGQGPELYEIKLVGGKRIKHFVDVPEIRSWLNSWNYVDYLLKATVDFRTTNGHFTKYFRNRLPRINGKGAITHLEHVSNLNARFEFHEKSPTSIIVGNFENPFSQGLTRYPIFYRNQPFANPVTMNYSNLYTFAMDLYSLPSWYGIISWIKLGSTLPTLLMNYNINSAAIRYHIESPAIYWEQKNEQLKKNCELKNIPYTSDLLEELKDEIYLKFADGLVGIEKAGKMITSETIFDEFARQYIGWKITTIDQKVKDYIDAQLLIAKRSDFAVTAGIGLHPALSNMSADGNLPSGSEQLYAFKLYLKTGVDIPEYIVCKDINNAIAANFPERNVKIGFYHDLLLTEEQTTPANRLRNS